MTDDSRRYFAKQWRYMRWTFMADTHLGRLKAMSRSLSCSPIRVLAVAYEQLNSDKTVASNTA